MSSHNSNTNIAIKWSFAFVRNWYEEIIKLVVRIGYEVLQYLNFNIDIYFVIFFLWSGGIVNIDCQFPFKPRSFLVELSKPFEIMSKGSKSITEENIIL